MFRTLFRQYRAGLIAVVVVAVLAVAGILISRGLAAPRIKLDRLTHDFGTVDRGALLQTRFTYWNTGRLPATIEVEKTSCACSGAVLKTDQLIPTLGAAGIQPGATGSIEVSVDTYSLSDGPTKKLVTIATNDPRQMAIKLELSLNVRSEFALSERSIEFGPVRQAEPRTRSISIDVSESSSARLLGATIVGGTSFSADLTKHNSEPRRFQLTVALKKDARQGQHFGTAIVRTSSKSLPEMRIPLHAELATGSAPVGVVSRRQ